MPNETESRITPQDAAAIRGQISELERQRNGAFTRAAQLSGELEAVKQIVGERDKTIAELEAVVAEDASAIAAATLASANASAPVEPARPALQVASPKAPGRVESEVPERAEPS